MDIHPALRHLLESVQKRQRRLLAARGAMTSFASIVLGVLAATALDAALLFEDRARCVAFFTIASGATLALWLRAGRRLWISGTPRQVALLIENREPGLRGTLLSTVELSGSTSASGGSEELRELLQQRTASATAEIRSDHLLPWSLVRGDLLMALASLSLLLVGIAVDGTNFGTRCLRIVLPLADIARPSDIVIHLLNTNPGETTVPAGEPVEIVAAITGQVRGEPFVRMFGRGEGGTTVVMKRSGDGKFNAVIPAGQTSFEYCVLADDAQSARQRIIPKPRPSVIEFERTYTPPAYAGLPQRDERGKDGGIEGLEGSEVKLSFKADQSLKGGSLALSCGKSPEHFALTSSGEASEILTCVITLKESGVYNITLVGMETGFISARDLQYAVRVEPDAPPNITLISPSQDLVVELGDKVDLHVFAEDDIRLQQVVRETRINQGPWRKVEVLDQPRKSLELKNIMDPLEDGPKAGDVLTIRFSAYDGKGQRSDSRELHVGFNSAGTLPKAGTELAGLRDRNRALEAVNRQASEAARALGEAKAKMEPRAGKASGQQQAIARARESLEAAVEGAHRVRSEIQEELMHEQPPAVQAALKLQAQALSRVELGQLEQARRLLQKLSADPDQGNQPAESPEALKQAADAAAKGAALANTVKEAVKTELAKVEARELAPIAAALAKEQGGIQKMRAEGASHGEDSISEHLLGDTLRRQQVNQAAAAALQKELQALAERSGAAGSRLNPANSALAEAARNADRALTATQGERSKGTDARAVARATDAGTQLARSLQKASEVLTELQPALQDAAQKALQKLSNETTSGAERTAQATREVEGMLRNSKPEGGEASQLAAEKLAAEAAVLKADAETAAADRSSAGRVDLDRRLAAAVLDAAAEEIRTGRNAADEPTQKTIAATARALQTLEAAALVKEGLKATLKISELQSRMQGPVSPADVEEQRATARALGSTASELRRAGLKANAAEAVTEAQSELQKTESGSAQRAAQKMQAASEGVREAESAARAELQAMAPSISSRLEALANAAERNAMSGEALSHSSENTTPAVPASHLKAEQEFLAKAEDLRREIQADASNQSLLTPEGRERMRDDDDAAALLKGASKALEMLKAAQASKAETRSALDRATDQQRQNAGMLKQLAGHFRNLEAGDSNAVATSRIALRNSEQKTGVQAALEARHQRAEELAQLSQASAEEARTKLDALNRADAEGTASADSGRAMSSPRNAAEEAALQSKQSLAQAREALKSGDGDQAKGAISAAVGAQQDSARLSRSMDSDRNNGPSQGGSPQKPTSEAGSLPSLERQATSKAWGNLPQRIADDLMQGKREEAPNEYRASIDAYFQAVAEKARGTPTRR